MFIKTLKKLINKPLFEKPSFDDLSKFLINEKGFSENRVEGLIKRLKTAISIKPQMSIESFFGKSTPNIKKNKAKEISPLPKKRKSK